MSSVIYSQRFEISKTDSDSLWNDIYNLDQDVTNEKYWVILMPNSKLIFLLPGVDAFCLLWTDLPDSVKMKLIKRNLPKS